MNAAVVSFYFAYRKAWPRRAPAHAWRMAVLWAC